MRQYVLCLTEAMPHAGDERDCDIAEPRSVNTQASGMTKVRCCWTKTHSWRRHRPRSGQVGIPRYGTGGGLRAFA